ncbi:MAG: radical SAM protein, partial [Kiloniellales bacterium]|nr:radical SAM protein [Kiloniellales bacterium]
MLAAPIQHGTTKSLFATPKAGFERRLPRKRALVVNCFIDEYRRTRGSPHRVPRAMGPPFLAGALAPEAWDIRLYNEQYSGPLSDDGLLGWPDLLVLTGLTVSFDRMMQLTAYARSLNPKVVVAAGGPPVRALPRRAAGVFDYACTGDLEELQEVVREAFGRGYAAETLFPRFDLPYGRGIIGYVESSRNCNFRCSFCSLTGEKGRYLTYDLDMVRRQILACGKKQICFLDNNFYGNDRDYFLAKVALCRELVEDRTIDGWSCLVTGDFFARPDNLGLVSRSGCKILFSGVESFSQEILRRYNKKQNTIVPQVEMVRGCLEAGVVFAYGIMLDPSTRRLDDLRGEIEFVVGTPEITLPAYFTLAIPLIGTPYFRDCLAEHRFFPNTRLRNLDGVTLTMQPRDPLGEVLAFLKDLPSLRGYRKDALRHAARFAKRYRGALEPLQLFAALLPTALICTEFAASSPTRIQFARPRQTYYGPSEALDPFYTPRFRVDARFRDHFRPTMITDPDGAPHPDIVE